MNRNKSQLTLFEQSERVEIEVLQGETHKWSLYKRHGMLPGVSISVAAKENGKSLGKSHAVFYNNRKGEYYLFTAIHDKWVIFAQVICEDNGLYTVECILFYEDRPFMMDFFPDSSFIRQRVRQNRVVTTGHKSAESAMEFFRELFRAGISRIAPCDFVSMTTPDTNEVFYES